MSSTKQKQAYSLGKKISIIIMWAVGIALLLGVGSYTIWKGSQDSVERAIRSATYGMIFGILFGASNAGVIQGRRKAVLVGLLGGVIASPVYWVGTYMMGEEIAVRGQGILLSLILFGTSGFVTGVLYGVLLYDKRENKLGS